eukprot:GGOE01041657.1.p1 GENE.GGOE01041657.1~~GGOE01041657.1.p1  ORF type:complete len:991 (+),score=254.97 GGOE01041657.1:54-3026(+)
MVRSTTVAKSSPLWRLGCQLYLLPEEQADSQALLGKLAFARHLHWHDDDEDGVLTYPEFLASMHVVGGIEDGDIDALFEMFSDGDDVLDIEELLGGFLMTEFVRLSATARRRLLGFVGRCLAARGLPPEVDVSQEANLADFTFTLRSVCNGQLDDLDLELVYSFFQMACYDCLSWSNFLRWCSDETTEPSRRTALSHSETTSLTSSRDSALITAAPPPAGEKRHRTRPTPGTVDRWAGGEPPRPPFPLRADTGEVQESESGDEERGSLAVCDSWVAEHTVRHGRRRSTGPLLDCTAEDQGLVVRRSDAAALTGAIQALERTLRDHEQRLLDRHEAFEQRLEQRLEAVGAELGERLGERIVAHLSTHLERHLETRLSNLTTPRDLEAETERRQRLDAEVDLRLALDREREHRLELEHAVRSLKQQEQQRYVDAGKLRYEELLEKQSEASRRPSRLTDPGSMDVPAPVPVAQQTPPATPPLTQQAAAEPPQLPSRLRSSSESVLGDAAAAPVVLATATGPNTDEAVAAEDVFTQPVCPTTTLPIAALHVEQPVPPKVAAVLAHVEFAALRRLPVPQLRRQFGRWDKKKTGCINFHGFCQMLLDACDHLSDLTEVQMERVFQHFGDRTFEVLTWEQFQRLLSVPVRRASSVSPTHAAHAVSQCAQPPAPSAAPKKDSVGGSPTKVAYPFRPELLERPEMVALRRLPPPQLRHLFKQQARDVGTINHHQYMDLVRTYTPADTTLSDGELQEIYHHFADPATGFMTVDRFMKSIHPSEPVNQVGRLTPRSTTTTERHRPSKSSPRTVQQLHAALLERCYHPARPSPIQGTLALLQYGCKGDHRNRVGIDGFEALLVGLGVHLGSAEAEELFQHHATGGVVDWGHFVESLRGQQRLGLNGAEFHRVLDVIRSCFAAHHGSPIDSAQLLAPFRSRDHQRTGKLSLIPFTEVVQAHCKQLLTDYEVELVFNRLADDRLQELYYLEFVEVMSTALPANP